MQWEASKEARKKTFDSVFKGRPEITEKFLDKCSAVGCGTGVLLAHQPAQLHAVATLNPKAASFPSHTHGAGVWWHSTCGMACIQHVSTAADPMQDCFQSNPLNSLLHSVLGVLRLRAPLVPPMLSLMLYPANTAWLDAAVFRGLCGV